MGDKRPYKPRKTGAGRKPLKPDYNAAAILQEQMQAAVVLYEEDNSLQSIADALSLNPIKVRKLLITAGAYESETADAVNSAFEAKQGITYKEALEAVAAELNLSKASVTSYFSAVEARVLAWEAGEDWRLEAFLEGKDIYCASASQMFHVPVVKHGINGELRQKGKVAERLCGNFHMVAAL